MALKVGDKCPQCKQGLLERSDVGIDCTQCSFALEIEEVVVANAKSAVTAGEYVFKPKTFKITVDDPEELQEFLRGCILARQNNNSPYFVDLIDACNTLLEPWLAAKQREEMAARGQ